MTGIYTDTAAISSCSTSAAGPVADPDVSMPPVPCETIEMLLREGNAVRSEHVLSSLIRDNDTPKIILYLSPDIARIALTLSQHAGLAPGEVAMEGVQTAAEMISRGALQSPPQLDRVIDVISKAMRAYAFNTRLEAENIIPQSDQLEVAGYDPMRKIERQDLLENLRKGLEKWLGTLSINIGQCFRMAHGILGEEKVPINEIRETLNVPVQNLYQGLSRARRDMRSGDSAAFFKQAFADLFEKGFGSGRFNRTLNNEHDNEHDNDLATRLGTSLLELRRRIGLTIPEMAAIVRHAHLADSTSDVQKLVSFSEAERAKFTRRSGLTRLSTSTIGELELAIDRLARADSFAEAVTAHSLGVNIRDVLFSFALTDIQGCILFAHQQNQRAELPLIVRQAYRYVADFYERANTLEVPGLKTSLDLYQRIDIAIAMERNSILNANGMGTGKSIEQIAVALLSGAEKVLIVSTKSGVHSTWSKEIAKHVAAPGGVEVVTRKALRRSSTRHKFSSAKWLLTTHTSAALCNEWLRHQQFDFIVIDECQKVARGGERSRAVLSLNAKRRAAVSGTPFKNNRAELFPVLNWLFPDKFLTELEFLENYCINREGSVALADVLAPRVLYRPASLVLNLPNLHRETVTVTPEPAAWAQYQALEQDFVSWLKANRNHLGENLSMGMAVLNKIHVLRQATLQMKLGVAAELVSSAIREGHGPIAFVPYLEACKALYRKLDAFSPFMLTGATSGGDRKRIVELFRESRGQRPVVFSLAGAESVDLSSGDTVILVGGALTWADEDQIIKRVHRRGQERPVCAKTLIIPNSIDARIEALIEEKKQEHSSVWDSEQILGVIAERHEEAVGKLIKGYLADLDESNG